MATRQLRNSEVLRVATMFSQEAADKAITFIEKQLTLTDDFLHQPFKLIPFWKEAITELYGRRREDGTKQYREAGWWVARKNAKTQIAAAIACEHLENYPMQGEAYVVAGDIKQASILFNKVVDMLMSQPLLGYKYKHNITQKMLTNTETGTTLTALSSDGKLKHGYNSTLVIADEIHVWPKRELWTALTTGSGTRKEWLFVTITTAGVYDAASFETEMYEYAKKIKDGREVDEEYFPLICEVDIDAEWTDEREWYKANPALGLFRSLDEMRKLCEKAKKRPQLQNDFRRLYLNQHTAQQTRWLPMDDWNKCDGDIEIEEGQPFWGGLDLASTSDLACWMKCFLTKDRHYVLVPTFYCPADRMNEVEEKDNVPYSTWAREGFIKPVPGRKLEFSYIHDDIVADCQKYDCQEIGYDNWQSSHTAEILEKEFEITMVELQQTVRHLSEPSKELERAVVTHQLRHGGHPVLKWCAENVEVWSDCNGNIRPIKAKYGGAGKKIDGIVAAIMSIHRAMLAVNEPEPAFDEDDFVYV